MNPNALRRLQEIDDHLVSLQEQRRHSAERLRLDPDVERAQRNFESASESQRGAAAELSVLEQELSEVSNRARALHRRLYGGSVHNPHELLELQHELEGLSTHVTEVEERALAAMELSEQRSEEERERVAELNQAERVRSDQEAPLRERIESLDAAIAESQQEREVASSSLAADERALYARVAAKHRPAVVSIVGDACGGCRLPLSHEERRAVRSGERIVQCSNCDRILVP